MEIKEPWAGYIRVRMSANGMPERIESDVLPESVVKSLVDLGETVSSVEQIPVGRTARWGMGNGLSKIVLENW